MVGRAAPKSPWRCCRPRGGPRTQSPQHQRGRAATLTTAIYAHLDDAALRDAAAQAAAIIAGAMGYKAAPPPLPDAAEDGEDGETPDTPAAGDAGAARPAPPDKPPAHGLRRRPGGRPGRGARPAGFRQF